MQSPHALIAQLAIDEWRLDFVEHRTAEGGYLSTTVSMHEGGHKRGEISIVNPGHRDHVVEHLLKIAHEWIADYELGPERPGNVT